MGQMGLAAQAASAANRALAAGCRLPANQAGLTAHPAQRPIMFDKRPTARPRKAAKSIIGDLPWPSRALPGDHRRCRRPIQAKPS